MTSPAFVGKVDNFRTFASNFGGISTVIQGFDFSTTARLSGKTLLQAGLNAQKLTSDSCNAPAVGTTIVIAGGAASQVGNPEKLFCAPDLPVPAGRGRCWVLTLPFDVQISGTYQLTQGPNFLAPDGDQRRAHGGGLDPGRALVSTSKTFNIIAPGVVYGENLQPASTCARPSGSR